MLLENTIDKKEAPLGFFAVLKEEVSTPNVCDSCDAKKLCKEDKNDWCLINRCMSFPVISFKDGKEYGRKDGQSVIFKLLDSQE